MTNRIIERHDRDNAARLKSIWNAYKARTRMTQEELARKMGFESRSVISQYLNCHIPMGTDAVLAFSKALDVAPTDIDPRLSAFTLTTSTYRLVRVPIIETLTGEAPGTHEAVEIMTESNKNLYAVAVNTDGFAPYVKQGATLIVCPDEEPVTGDEVYICLDTPAGELHLIKRYVTRDLAADTVVVCDLSDLTGAHHEVLPAAKIRSLDPIHSVVNPRVNRPTRLRPRAVNN